MLHTFDYLVFQSKTFIMKKEEIKDFELYTFVVERFHNSESSEDKNYLNIVIKQFDFEDVNLDYFEDYMEEIKDKNNEEFLDWLEEQAGGYGLQDLLENEAGVNLYHADDKFFIEETEEEVIDDSKLFEADDFQLTNSQPSIGEEYFFSIDEVKKEICSQYSFYNSCRSKDNLKDYKGATANFTKAIELNPDDALAYLKRGVSKNNLKDYKGAIADYTKAIELNPDDALAYLKRGVSKDNLKDDKGAIADYTKAIEIDPDNALAYSNRASKHKNLNDLNGACADWRKAASLGDESAKDYVRDRCN